MCTHVGQTPLHWAADKGYVDVMNSLLNSSGCDINLQVMKKSVLGFLTFYKQYFLINFIKNNNAPLHTSINI